MKIDLQNHLFLCPVFFDSDPIGANRLLLPLNKPDYALHFTANAAKMSAAGSTLICMDGIPADYAPAKTLSGEVIRLRKITAPDGKDYIPLFLHYQGLTAIYGKNIHIGVVSLTDVRQLCLGERSISGIVIAPGTANQIIPREALLHF